MIYVTYYFNITLMRDYFITLNYLFDELTKYKHRLIMWFRLK